MTIGQGAIGEDAIGGVGGEGFTPPSTPSVDVDLVSETTTIALLARTLTRVLASRTLTVAEEHDMTIEQRFSPKDPSEEIIYGIDFTSVLGEGEAIASCVFSVSVVSPGTNSSPLALSGAADLTDSPVMKQKLTGGTSGLTYRVKATVTTNLRVLVGSGLLDLIDGA